VQRGKREQKGCFHGRSDVHSFHFAIDSVLTMPLVKRGPHFTDVETEGPKDNFFKKWNLDLDQFDIKRF